MAEKKPLAKRRKVGINEPLPPDFDEETAKIQAEIDRIGEFIRSTGRAALMVDDKVRDRRRNLRKRLEIRRATKKRLSSRKRP